MTIRIRTLGPLALATDAGDAPAELRWRKHAALLVYLARAPSRTATREHLVGLLWPEKPESAARHSLSEAIRILRRAEPDGVEALGGQVRLAAGAVALDVDDLERLARGGRVADAAALVGGEFLEGFAATDAPAFEDWLAAERLHWRRRAVALLVRHAEELLDFGRLDAAAETARRAERLDPTSDAAARAAMRAAALAGHRGAALETYRRLGERLAEIGASPETETAGLAERIARERSPSAAAGRDPAEPRRFPLAGRERELRELAAAWRDARGLGRPAVLLVEGDVGAGRTRLAEELVERARLDGAAAVALRAVEADGLAAWNGVLALARGGLLDLPGLARAQPGALAAFAAHLPEWADRFPAARNAPALPLERALADVLLAAAAESPTLLVADDAHRLDRASLLALLALAREHAPLALCLTTASHEHRSELDAAAAALGRGVPGALVRLGPLGQEEIAAMTAAALPALAPEQRDRLARRVLSDSAGLPLLAVELLQALAAGLDLDPGLASWPAPLRTLDAARPVELPGSVVAAIRLNARRLSPAALDVLAAVSVPPPPVSLATAARAADLDERTVAAALDELEWRRWLTSDRRGYAFLAGIVRDVIRSDLLTPGRRRRIGERLGLDLTPA